MSEVEMESEESLMKLSSKIENVIESLYMKETDLSGYSPKQLRLLESSPQLSFFGGTGNSKMFYE